MNRKEIKEEAKAKIKGNKWNILWPLLAIGAIEGVIDSILRVIFKVPSIDYISMENLNTNVPMSYSITSLVIALIIGLISAGYIKYILDFVRTGKFNANVIIDTFKKKWSQLLIATILVFVVVYLCTLLFIIPGIIMALAYSFVSYIIVDNDNIGGKDALTKSREMMKGYKWDYFVFDLSFIGWILLIPFTLGIILIWLLPYIVVANTLYYENLKSLK